MNIYILSINARIYSTNRLYHEAAKKGHHVRIIDHTKCAVILGDEAKSQIYAGPENITNGVDAIIPRIGTSVTQHGAAIAKQFEMNGAFTTAKSAGIIRSRNKLRTMQLLAQKRIPIPKTLFAKDTSNIKQHIELLGGAPIIIKLQEGTQGLGVMIAESEKSAKSIIESLYTMNVNIILQEFIEEANGQDIRVYIVGNKIVASMMRSSTDEDFRSNVHRGGKTESVTLTGYEKKIALQTAKVLDLPVCGVDIIRSKRGPLVIEANSSAGLEGIESHTKVNIAGEIIKYLEKNVRKFGK
ncbi:Ribosomal protein S6--L-glutamate ligase [Kordia antarctica]|uniref:Ribosomal protein S6--L-glutamate ligase n=1 Tax=Kordia antarctica TaxID=1218801 RepID=A0A7L4ZMS5_9FLAO|nr:RimK family alpha-L-glutamate ligase [Kordia antarctica]QHI37972.1 Ribosomal protein S6--L-glutamate ligase [Kordia antarctica]